MEEDGLKRRRRHKGIGSSIICMAINVGMVGRYGV